MFAIADSVIPLYFAVNDVAKIAQCCLITTHTLLYYVLCLYLFIP